MGSNPPLLKGSRAFLITTHKKLEARETANTPNLSLCFLEHPCLPRNQNIYTDCEKPQVLLKPSVINLVSPEDLHRCAREVSGPKAEWVTLLQKKISQPNPRLKNVNKVLQNQTWAHQGFLPLWSAQGLNTWQKGKGWASAASPR